MAAAVNLTQKEAAQILGLTTSATKADINAAYRRAVAKYHPDANRDKSPEEQKKAEQQFKKVGLARKIMLNPALAAPEPEDVKTTTTPSTTSSAHATAQTANKQQDTVSPPSRKPATSYNKSQSCYEDVAPIVDPAEETLAKIYDEETRDEYTSFSDRMRVVPSTLVSVGFVVLSICSFFMIPFTPANLTFSNPNIILTLIFLVKILTYDLFAAYYVHGMLEKKITYSWCFLSSIEIVLCSVIAIICFTTHPLLASSVSIVASVLLLIVGVAMAAVAVILTKQEQAKKEK